MLKMEYLEWDSNFFGIDIYDLQVKNISSQEKKLIREKVKMMKFDIIQSKIDIHSTDNINCLENLGFRFIDLHITFKKIFFRNVLSHNNQKNEIEIQNATIKDIKEIEKLVSNKMFTYSRYYSMPISEDKINSFYSIWAKKAIAGTFDDFCLKATYKEKIVGLVTCKIINTSEAKIGIIGVDNNFRGRNIGHMMVLKLEEILKDKNIKFLYVTTEGRNIQAQNFYLKNSFSVHQIKLIMYLYGQKKDTI